MKRPAHGRRAKRAQWLRDVALLQLEYGLIDCIDGIEHAARVLRRESATRRARRLAKRSK